MADAPASNASTEDWQAFARTLGADEAVIAASSRNELRDMYAAGTLGPATDEQLQVAAAVAVAGKLADAEKVRLVPADWTVTTAEWLDPDGEVVSVTRPHDGYQGFIVDAGQADDIITDAGTHGVPIVKELIA